MNIEKDINLLVNIAMPKIESAFKSGNGRLYGELGKKYGPIAHKVYMRLDAPSKSTEWDFFDNPNKSVLLDPMTVANRAEDLIREGKDANPGNPEFWCHVDLIKSLVEYLLISQPVEG